MEKKSNRSIVEEVKQNQDPKWTIVHLGCDWLFVKQWLLFVPVKVDKTLTNPWEQTEPTRDSICRYMDIDSSWWKLLKFTDFSWKITEVKESPNKNSCQIMYKNQEKVITHQLHKQEEIINQVGTPEKILTEIFGLTEKQIEFKKDRTVKLWQTIEFTSEQKNKIQQLLENQVLQLAGFRNSNGTFNSQGKYGYLWTSIPWVYIRFGEDAVCIDNDGLSCSFSAVRSEN